MMKKSGKNTLKYYFIFITVGLLSGFICGFLGTGGGILIVFALSKFLPEFGYCASDSLCGNRLSGVSTAINCRTQSRSAQSRFARDSFAKDCFAKDCFAMTVAAVIPISAVSALLYYKFGIFSASGVGAGGAAAGNVLSQENYGILAQFLVPAAAGGIAGALLLDKISTGFLKKLFGAVIIIGGALMIFRR